MGLRNGPIFVVIYILFENKRNILQRQFVLIFQVDYKYLYKGKHALPSSDTASVTTNLWRRRHLGQYTYTY